MPARLRASLEDESEGFTLIELLVVIIIIGILAAIAIPVFLNQRKKGYQASMKSDLRAVANEMETNFVDSKTYVGISNFGVGSAITGTGSVGGDGVTLSAGTTITLTAAGTTGFCLTAVSSKSTGVTYIYDSLKGGLNTTPNAACQAASAYSN